ncbi:MAG: hypothetical protein ACK5M0_09780 [Bacteroidales bacterium]
MKRIIILIILLTLSINVFCQDSKLIGRYKCIPDSEFPSDSIILELKENGLFEYTPSFINYMGLIRLCKSTSGEWSLDKNHITLNSNLQTTNPKNCIKHISTFEYPDSIKLQFINHSDSSAVEGMGLFFYNKNKSNSVILETNKNGEIVIPSKEYYPSSLMMDVVGNYINMDNLKGGNYYQILYFDCYPDIFTDEKLEIKGDTLIWNESGGSKELYKKL